MDDLERAKSLGMTLEQFQQLVGHDPLSEYTEFLQASCMSEEGEEGEEDETIPAIKNVEPQLTEMEAKLKLKRKQ